MSCIRTWSLWLVTILRQSVPCRLASHTRGCRRKEWTWQTATWWSISRQAWSRRWWEARPACTCVFRFEILIERQKQVVVVAVAEKKRTTKKKKRRKMTRAIKNSLRLMPQKMPSFLGFSAAAAVLASAVVVCDGELGKERGLNWSNMCHGMFQMRDRRAILRIQCKKRTWFWQSFLLLRQQWEFKSSLTGNVSSFFLDENQPILIAWNQSTRNKCATDQNSSLGANRTLSEGLDNCNILCVVEPNTQDAILCRCTSKFAFFIIGGGAGGHDDDNEPYSCTVLQSSKFSVTLRKRPFTWRHEKTDCASTNKI